MYMTYFQEQLNTAGLHGVWEKLVPYLKHSVKIKPKVSGVGINSRIGGMPTTAVPFSWPKNARGDDLSFIAQIDFEEIKPFDPVDLFPYNGVLYFFYDAYYQPSGNEPQHRYGWRVIYQQHVHQPLMTMWCPQGLKERNHETIFDQLIFSTLPIGFYGEDSLPPYESSIIKSLGLDFDHLWKYEQFYFEQVNQKPKYRVLGFPDRKIVNHDMPATCQAMMEANEGGSSGKEGPPVTCINAHDEWVLLLQVDSDIEVGMTWGGEEMGRIYFWIRKPDLQTRNFDRCWVVLESN